MRKQIFISLFIATLIAMLSLGIITPILPLYAKSMNATGLELGLIFSGFALSRGIFAPIIGQFSDQYGRKKLIVIGLVLFIILSLCFVVAASPIALTIIRVIQGFSTVLVTPVAQSYIGDITPVGKEGRYMNLFFMSFFAGQALGPYFGGFLTDRFSINIPFYAMAILSLLALILILFFVPESEAIKNNGKEKQPILRSLIPVFKDKPMLGIMTYFSSRGFYRWGFNTFFPLLAVKTASTNAAGIGLVLSVYMLSGSLTQYPFGLVSDKFPRQKVTLIFVGGIVAALAMCVVAQFSSMEMFLILTLIMGIFSSVSRASAIAIRTERGRVHGMGATTGAFTASLSLGQVFGPVVFGVVVDAFSIPVAFLVGGIVGIIGTVAASIFLKVKTDY
jgi:MFS transporter, DHA1 family, multidrug resistance protein